MRRVTHGVNCHQRWPEFRVDDSEATTSPRLERARGQEHGWKAGDSGRWVRCGPATPERYGEDWIVCTPISRGGTAHASAAHLTPTPSRAMGPPFADGTPCVMADAQRGYARGCMGRLRRSRTFLGDGTRDGLKDASPKITECQESSWESRPTRAHGRAVHRGKWHRWLESPQL